jgi:hypothetical protein
LLVVRPAGSDDDGGGDDDDDDNNDAGDVGGGGDDEDDDDQPPPQLGMMVHPPSPMLWASALQGAVASSSTKYYAAALDSASTKLHVTGSTTAATLTVGSSTLTRIGTTDCLLTTLDVTTGAASEGSNYGGATAGCQLRAIAVPSSSSKVAAATFSKTVTFAGDSVTSKGGDDLAIVVGARL